MWSRRFLWTGLSSGTAVAALTLAGLFLVLFVWFGGKSSDSKIVALASPGVIVAPACWYVIIFRQRDYSLSKTMMLVGVAFGVVTLIIALLHELGRYRGLRLYGGARRTHPEGVSTLFIATLGRPVFLFR